MQTEEIGTLRKGEVHPAAKIAHKYIMSQEGMSLFMMLESFSSCALEGSRIAEVCAETLRRILHHEPVSDRYLMGLAWVIWEFEEGKNAASLSEILINYTGRILKDDEC